MQILESGLRFESTTKGVLVGKAVTIESVSDPGQKPPFSCAANTDSPIITFNYPKFPQEFFRNSSPHVARTKQSS